MKQLTKDKCLSEHKRSAFSAFFHTKNFNYLNGPTQNELFQFIKFNRIFLLVKSKTLNHFWLSTYLRTLLDQRVLNAMNSNSIAQQNGGEKGSSSFAKQLFKVA